MANTKLSALLCFNCKGSKRQENHCVLYTSHRQPENKKQSTVFHLSISKRNNICGLCRVYKGQEVGWGKKDARMFAIPINSKLLMTPANYWSLDLRL